MRVRRLFAAAVVLALSAACSLDYLSRSYGEGADDGGPDADAATRFDAAVDASCDGDCQAPDASRCRGDETFGPIRTLTLGFTGDVQGGFVTADEQTLYHSSSINAVRGGLDLFRAKRRPGTDQFLPSTLLSASSSDDEWAPVLSADETTFVFARSPAFNAGFNRELRIATEPPVDVDGGADASASAVLAALDPDAGKTVYAAPYLVPTGAALYFVLYDGFTPVVYRAALASGVLGAPERLLVGVSSPVPSGDELTMYLARKESGIDTVVVARRPSTAVAWKDAPITTLPEITTGEDTVPTSLSQDGCVLYFNVAGKSVRSAQRGGK